MGLSLPYNLMPTSPTSYLISYTKPTKNLKPTVRNNTSENTYFNIK